MAKPFICAVVQGNLRRGTSEVLACLSHHFEKIILSTWEDEPAKQFRSKKVDIVLSKKPDAPGYTNRNYQRRNTAAGIRRAEELGATHVLKWRTDMLPTKLDVRQLMEWSEYDPPSGLDARLVTCAFRNLSVEPDWFSTIPDLFAFSSLPMMKLLWGDEGLDYKSEMNVPTQMIRECGLDWRNEPTALTTYGPEAELYAIFRNRLETVAGKSLTHPVIARRYMHLFDHHRLQICWFGQSGFRSIVQAVQHPWWTESVWLGEREMTAPAGYHLTTWRQRFRRKFVTRFAIRQELNKQRQWYRDYQQVWVDGNNAGQATS